MKWQEFIKDYLTFTRKERIALLLILFIILIVIFLPKILTSPQKSYSLDSDSSWANAIKRLEQKEPENLEKSDEGNSDDGYAYQYDPPVTRNTDQKTELFYFDPNTLPLTGWKKLGLREKNIQTIINYLRKGGHFYTAKDLQKIYGLHKEDYERIAPYVRINTPNNTRNEVRTAEPSEKQTNNPGKKNFNQYSIIDINSADTTAYISLPGIGSKLAARIVNFREKLGGFYSIDQISETFGLPDSTFRRIKQYLEIKNPALRKININTATIEELKAHPYIKWSLANPLIAYRNEHGAFATIEDIKKIPSVTDELFNKLAPYLIAQ